jgi:hypothetical protein
MVVLRSVVGTLFGRNVAMQVIAVRNSMILYEELDPNMLDADRISLDKVSVKHKILIQEHSNMIDVVFGERALSSSKERFWFVGTVLPLGIQTKQA